MNEKDRKAFFKLLTALRKAEDMRTFPNECTSLTPFQSTAINQLGKILECAGFVASEIHWGKEPRELLNVLRDATLKFADKVEELEKHKEDELKMKKYDDMSIVEKNQMAEEAIDNLIKKEEGNPHVEEKIIKEVQCNRCYHKWIPRTFTPPDRCPKCNSPYWNKEHVRKRKEKEVRNE